MKKSILEPHRIRAKALKTDRSWDLFDELLLK